jgi:hypothetical protein
VLRARFLPAYLVSLDKLAEQDYFAELAPDTCVDGHPQYWDAEAVNKALVGQMGIACWPLTDSELATFDDATVIEYVEGFYKIVSKPTESWFHSYCGTSHPLKFSQPAGRYDYTVMVNGLFDRFGTGHRIQGGAVRSAVSAVLSPRLSDPLPFGGDDHLQTLIRTGLGRFTSSDPQQRWEAVRLLADAYERIKTIKQPSNKKVSTGLLVNAISTNEQIAEHIEALFRTLTSTSNDLTIRHHEHGKVGILHDADLIDFLFYSYYNVIRLSLIRLYGS